jgi:hypothetical protein
MGALPAAHEGNFWIQNFPFHTKCRRHKVLSVSHHNIYMTIYVWYTEHIIVANRSATNPMH